MRKYCPQFLLKWDCANFCAISEISDSKKGETLLISNSDSISNTKLSKSEMREMIQRNQKPGIILKNCNWFGKGCLQISFKKALLLNKMRVSTLSTISGYLSESFLILLIRKVKALKFLLQSKKEPKGETFLFKYEFYF